MYEWPCKKGNVPKRIGGGASGLSFDEEEEEEEPAGAGDGGDVVVVAFMNRVLPRMSRRASSCFRVNSCWE